MLAIVISLRCLADIVLACTAANEYVNATTLGPVVWKSEDNTTLTSRAGVRE